MRSARRRVLTISPDEFSRIGSMQYKQSLPLADHEVVITFDDGPLPPYSNIILDTFASQCVKATYFLVGQMAHAYPSVVRRIYNAGHTIGTHSRDHPLAFERLPLPRVEHEVDGGIASVDAAIGDPKAVSPFFRIPGLGRTNAIENFLPRKTLVTWSADVVTDDWWGISAQPDRPTRDAPARRQGPRHPAAARHPSRHRDGAADAAQGTQGRGYHVVQVVPAGERPASVPVLVAAEDKGNWPRVLKTSATVHHATANIKRRCATTSRRCTPRSGIRQRWRASRTGGKSASKFGLYRLCRRGRQSSSSDARGRLRVLKQPAARRAGRAPEIPLSHQKLHGPALDIRRNAPTMISPRGAYE